MVLDAREGNRIVIFRAVGSTDTQLTKFFDLRILIVDNSIIIVIYFVYMKYILVVGIFGNYYGEHLHFNRFKEWRCGNTRIGKSIISTIGSIVWLVLDLSSD